MEVIHVVFIGLVSHMNLLDSYTAVMPVTHDGTHVQEMHVFHAAGGVDPYQLTGMRVAISKPSGSPTSDPNWVMLIDDTPQLDDICGVCAPTDAVQKRIADPNKNVAAYIDYEGGVVGPFGYDANTMYFDHGAHWGKPGHCVECGTELDLPVNDGGSVDITFTRLDGATSPPAITVTASDVVVFRNGPPVGTTVTGDHWHEFYNLFKSCKNMDTPHTGGACVIPHPACVDVTPQDMDTRFLGLLEMSYLWRNESRAAVHTAIPRIQLSRVDWSKFDITDFKAFIVTPNISCTSSQYP